MHDCLYQFVQNIKNKVLVIAFVSSFFRFTRANSQNNMIKHDYVILLKPHDVRYIIIMTCSTNT
jgi:hypothetical protein